MQSCGSTSHQENMQKSLLGCEWSLGWTCGYGQTITEKTDVHTCVQNVNGVYS